MIGLEPTFDEHLDNLVAVFREVRRVLRARRYVLFLNYGDSYADNDEREAAALIAFRSRRQMLGSLYGKRRPFKISEHGYKPKDLMGLPWRVAFALQDRRVVGAFRRSCGHKPNPMPESAQDRPTSAHEKLFLMTKAPRYLLGC